MAQSQSTVPGSDISFERRGGRFVSYKAAVALAILFLAILCLVFFLGRFSTGSTNKSMDDAPLPMHKLNPLHYNLVLKTGVDSTTIVSQNFTYSGGVDIFIHVKENTNHVVLNSRKLNILYDSTVLKRVTESDAKVNFETMKEIDLLNYITSWKNTSKNEINIDWQEVRKATELYIIHLAEPLEAGTVYFLSLQFENKIEEAAIGLYRAKCFTPTGQLRWVIGTRMEPDNARQVFPCFDQLDQKAMFTITLFHPEEYKALSNMAVRANYTDDVTGLQVTEFNTTPRLPPYLVSIVFTNYLIALSPEDKENIWLQPTLINDTNAASSMIPRMFASYQVLLNNKLPLDKIDFVGIPDYSTRGSESFGLIALEENLLLNNPRYSSLKQQDSITLHIGFHIAQQWFSNMVTPKSWRMLWLREAFAKYLSYNGANQAAIPSRLSDSFLVNEMQKSLHADSLHDAQPLLQMDSKPREIQLFNHDLTYSKGGCLIRMLNHFIGDINFKHGLQEYIRKWYLKSVNPSDVLESFDESISNLKMYDFNISVKEVMQSWVYNKGYPLVTVNIDRKNMVATFTQKSFSMFNEEDQQVWYIPISYTTKEQKHFNSTKTKLLLTSKTPVTVPLNKDSIADTWIIANLEQTGYFRVNYNTAIWEKLLLQLDQDYFSIPHLSRYQLLDDAFYLAHGQHIKYSIPLQLASLFGKYEKELIPWQGLLNHIEFIDGIFSDNALSQELYKTFIVKLLRRIHDELTSNKQSNTNSQENEYLLFLIREKMCYYEYEVCLPWAKKHFQEMLSNEEASHKIVNGSSRGTIYSVIARQGQNEDWLYLWNKIKDPSVDPIEKYYLAEGLASTTNDTTIQELLSQISKFDESVPIIRKTLSVEIWIQLGRHVSDLNIFLQLLRTHWKSLYLNLENHKDLLHKLLQGAGHRLNTAEHLNSVRELSNQHLSICAPEDKSLFYHLMEEINLKIFLRESHLQKMSYWIRTYNTQ